MSERTHRRTPAFDRCPSTDLVYTCGEKLWNSRYSVESAPQRRERKSSTLFFVHGENLLPRQRECRRRALGKCRGIKATRGPPPAALGRRLAAEKHDLNQGILPRRRSRKEGQLQLCLQFCPTSRTPTRGSQSSNIEPPYLCQEYLDHVYRNRKKDQRKLRPHKATGAVWRKFPQLFPPFPMCTIPTEKNQL